MSSYQNFERICLTTLKFKDAIGIDYVKEVLYNKVVAPIKNRKRHRTSETKEPVCILLHGPPGCGKQFLVYSMGYETGTKICTLSFSEIELICSGEGKRIFKDLFEIASSYGPSSLIFLKFFDAVVKQRLDALDCLIEEMNKASQYSDLYVIIFSNDHTVEYDSYIRQGLITTALYIGLPDKETGIRVLKHNEEVLIVKRLACDEDLDEIASQCRNFSVTQFVYLLLLAQSYALKYQSLNILKEHFYLALKDWAPVISDEAVRDFQNKQLRYENIIKKVAMVKSDVLAKSYSTLSSPK